jgi:predicted P-loop ATPase
MVILEGEQGDQKSMALSILGGEYFSDCLPDIATGSRDSSLHLNGKCVIEIAELHSMNRAENAAMKSFVTRTIEQYRHFYGRREAKEPRQCILVGTTNKQLYLKDETGNRRYWPVKTGAINLSKLQKSRDQLFAEAVVRFKNGEPWWPSREFEQQYIQIEQDERYEADAWEPAVAKYLREAMDAARASQTQPEVIVSDIARSCLGFDSLSRIGTADQRRITSILEHLGWKRGKRQMDRRPWMKPA